MGASTKEDEDGKAGPQQFTRFQFTNRTHVFDDCTLHYRGERASVITTDLLGKKEENVESPSKTSSVDVQQMNQRSLPDEAKDSPAESPDATGGKADEPADAKTPADGKDKTPVDEARPTDDPTKSSNGDDTEPSEHVK